MNTASLTHLIDAFHEAIHTEDWRGKTFRQFWQWFSAYEKSVLEQTPEALHPWMREQLIEVTAHADDAGFAVPSEMIDQPIYKEDAQ